MLQKFTDYLREVLGIPVALEAWPGVERLPFFLRDRYDFFYFTLIHTPYLLMRDRTEQGLNPLAISKHVAQVYTYWDGEVALLCDTISSYVRRRLIEQSISFVVPGHQLYLPSSGIALREYYRTKRPTVMSLSPSTQAVVIYALCHDAEQPFTPSMLAKRIGYTRMTMARAFDELAAVDIGEIVPKGKERLLHIPHGKRALWEQAVGFLRTPVRKRLWTRQPVADWPGVQAGLSALVSDSMLADPGRAVFAMSSMEWKAWKQQHGDAPEFEIPEMDEDSCELELWSYSPRLFAEHGRVDPFSLYLSTQSMGDERVQSALEQLLERALW